LDPHVLYAQYLDLDEDEDAAAPGGATTHAEADERKARLLDETGILGAEVLGATAADELATAVSGSPATLLDDMADESDGSAPYPSFSTT